MIWDSAPWKDRLLKDADVVERWAAKTQATERRSVLLEQKIFIAAYSIRKLLDAEKLSSSFNDRSIPSSKFSCVSDHVTSMNSHHVSELYDLERPVSSTVSTRELLNLIIHSLMFCEQLRDDLTVEGFFVTSDRHRHDYLWLIDVSRFLSLMRDVSRDYPSDKVRILDREKNEWYVWQGCGDPPRHVVERLRAIRAQRAKA